MIFEEICIANLFSYYGEQVFSLPSPTEGRPVILVSGRNGFGKTSFINSVKLLFLGTTTEMLSTVGEGLKLRPDTYLLGSINLGREWRGILNRRAREDGKPDTRYGIRIRWQEDQGTVCAERYWILNGEKLEYHLHIETDFETDFGKLIDDAESAEEFLERRLPKSIVPYFFYDGEQVQRLAEGNRQGQLQQIERLLDISTLDTLNEYLQKAINAWRQEGQGPEARAELDILLAHAQENKAKRDILQAQADDLTAEIENEERNIRRLEHQSDILRAKSLQRDEPRLREKLKTAKDAYEDACRKLAETLPVAAPLWAAPQLVQEVASKLVEATRDPNHLLSDQLKEIAAHLPEQLFDHPTHSSPHLNDDQKRHYKTKLRQLFTVFTEPPSGGFFSLNASQTQDIKARFEYYHRAQMERQHLAEDLKIASRLYREINDTQAQLDTLDNISPEEQRAFQERKLSIEQARKRQAERLKQQGGIEQDQARLETQFKDINKDIRDKETDVVKKDINSRRIDRARQAQRLFDDYKQRLKESSREGIEQAVNLRFKSLMTSHGLIDSIAVDTDFALTYHDARGQEVGMANISTGMKQLAAQALLWALSEVTTRHVPVIVDTPLARIDRAHQENLLKNYYPHAGEQVIVLPTDSEIDQDKYRLLLPHIAGEFRLENPDGEHTTVVANTKMYDQKAA